MDFSFVSVLWDYKGLPLDQFQRELIFWRICVKFVFRAKSDCMIVVNSVASNLVFVLVFLALDQPNMSNSTEPLPSIKPPPKQTINAPQTLIRPHVSTQALNSIKPLNPIPNPNSSTPSITFVILHKPFQSPTEIPATFPNPNPSPYPIPPNWTPISCSKP